jgi:carboxypeptidase Taq
MTRYEKLRGKLEEISDLNAAAALLSWDQQTFMPPGGAAARSEQLATLERLSHEKLISDEMGELLAAAAHETFRSPYDSLEASLVRVTSRDYEKARRIPSELVAELARTTSQALEVWVQARTESNYARFQPLLERIFQLNRDIAQCLGFKDQIYDALIDQYEPGMTVAKLAAIFLELRENLVPLVKRFSTRSHPDQISLLKQSFSAHSQGEFGMMILGHFGFDTHHGRQDKSVHPFTTSFSIHDVRITTRIDEHFLPSALFGTLHEGGHALYEQGIDPKLERTPLAGGASLGIHESQSRLWENLVGRSRSFWKYFYPRLQETFPQALGQSSLDDFYRQINQVEPSLIRVEADEVTYNLHILLRFELEIDLLENRLDFADLPAAWNQKMKEYLGITPPDDAAGLLQDVHWSSGLIGYFPTYTLGNLVAAQLFQKAGEQIPNLALQIEKGNFAELLGWLRQIIHRHGRKFMPEELVQRALGEGIQAEPFLEYLRGKYAKV